MDLTGIGGVWPATLTPFDERGGIDDAALRAHLRYVAATPGVKALVVNGHAGETTSLDRAERRHVIETARVVAPSRVGVVAGIVADDTRTACRLAQDAAEAGADALLLFPPSLFVGGAGARPDMAIGFVRAVAEAAELPIVLFQLSYASGLAYAPALLARLCAEIPAIIAVKEGSDIPELYETNLRALRRGGRPVTVLTTNNTWLFASLAYGADGILSGIGSVAAPLLVALFEASSRGDMDAARRANDRLLPLLRVFYRAPYLDMHNRMKTALHLMGLLPHPAPRPPLIPILAEEREAIRAALVESGLLAA
jgi:4-hydroxy-tetrahydrodipicolinate synthase